MRRRQYIYKGQHLSRTNKKTIRKIPKLSPKTRDPHKVLKSIIIHFVIPIGWITPLSYTILLRRFRHIVY